MKKWNDILEEENKLSKKMELITMRNTLEGLLDIAHCSDTYEDFVNNLQLLYDKVDELINE